MKVHIGPYEREIIPVRNWARRCKSEFISDRLYDLANFLKPVNTLHKKRKVKIKVHGYDTWNLDHTLSLIIHPLLVQLKDTQQGSPYVDDEDVPEHLRSTAAAPKENEWDTDSLHFDRWDWVMDEMIWAFGQGADDEEQFQHNADNLKMTMEDGKLTFGIEDPTKPEYFYDKEGHKAHEARKDNGRRLFAKYYRALWD